MARNILMIEDDAFFAEILQKKLESGGYSVTWADDGKVGLEKMKEVKPDLILLDIMLPSMSGYEILEHKNAEKEIKDIPVIVISNSGQPVEIERILDLGVEDYFIKAQFGPSEVIEKVEAYLGKEDAPTSEAEADEGKTSLKDKHILVVEDDEFLSDLLKQKFEFEGAKATQAMNGEEALAFLEETKPDIIMLDIVLPKMDGYEILDSIKNNERTASVPVIFLSNLGQQHEIEKGKEKGADGFLVKASFSLEQVIEEVKRTLQSKQ